MHFYQLLINLQIFLPLTLSPYGNLMENANSILRKKINEIRNTQPVMSINVILRLFAIGNEGVWKCSALFCVDSFIATTKISLNRKINFHLNDEKTATT